MTYEEFMEQPNKLGDLYVVVRKFDNKEIFRGASFNSVYFLTRENKEAYKIYIY